MRKLLCLLLALALFCALPALAQEQALEEGVLTELFDGDTIDLDGDGTPEAIGYSVVENADEGYTSFRLTIGKTQLDGDGDWLTGRLHALRMPLEAADDTLLFISDYGMSDDDTSYVYSYYEGRLSYVGTIATLPWDLTVSGANTLSGRVRGSILCTWNRPCEYVIGVTNGVNENYEYVGRRSLSIAEMPRSEYPMGFSVTTTRELALQVSRTNDATACVVPAGARVSIVATDDIEWLYIAPVEHSWEYDYPGGWLRVSDYGYSAVVGGESLETSELFPGLLYAD